MGDRVEGGYRRVLLKLGGEMFGGGSIGVDPDVVHSVAQQIAEVVRTGVQVAVVIGGGNFFRGAELSPARHGPRPRRLHGDAGHRDELPGAAGLPGEGGPRHPRADRHHDGPGRRALHPAPRRAAPGEGPRRDLRRRRRHAVLLHRHRGGAAGAGDRLRGRADGEGRRRRLHRGPEGRSRPPRCSARSPTARCWSADLKVADATAFSLCMDNNMPIIVFNLLTEGNIARAVRGEKIGTLVSTPADGVPA